MGWSHGQETFPLQNPGNEGRPGWWWDAFYGDGLIVKGKVTNAKKATPDVVMELTNAAAKEFFKGDVFVDENGRAQYLIAEVEIEKILHVPRGMEESWWGFQAKKGKLTKLKILMPCLRRIEYDPPPEVAREDETIKEKVVYESLDDPMNEGIIFLLFSDTPGVGNFVYRSIYDAKNEAEIERILQFRFPAKPE
jgi:hypothetical protein